MSSSGGTIGRTAAGACAHHDGPLIAHVIEAGVGSAHSQRENPIERHSAVGMQCAAKKHPLRSGWFSGKNEVDLAMKGGISSNMF